jgi:hypothetical protein
VGDSNLQAGLYEAILSAALDRRLAELAGEPVTAHVRELANYEAADRLSRHLATVVTRAIEALPEQERAQAGAKVVAQLIDTLGQSAKPWTVTPTSL